MMLSKRISTVMKLFIPLLYSDTKIIELQKFSHLLYNANRKRLAFIVENYILRKYKCAFSCQAKIGRNLSLPHPIGIVIGGGVIIEDDVTIYQNVTIGRRNSKDPMYPRIKSGTTIYCNSTIIGDITVASNTIIGANSLLSISTEDYGLYVGNPAKKYTKHQMG
jgi:serine O-acetyltransferase